MVTSAPRERLDAMRWLQANQQAWGIENGLHQRLDVSLNDDRCRVRSDGGMRVLGAYRRMGISLFMEWRSRQSNARHLTLTNFQAVMAEDHRTRALRFVLSKNPSLKTPS